MEDDVIGTMRELGGSPAAVCELCGRPVSPEHLERVSRDSGGGVEPPEAVGVCPRCRQALDSGELLPDAGVAGGTDDDLD